MRLIPLFLLMTLVGAAEDPHSDLAARAAAALRTETLTIRGRGDWFFTPQELAHYGSAAGYWNAAPTDPKAASPLEVIAAFKDNLATVGVELILVPVPGKLALHPEELDPPLAAPTGPRLDSEERAFYDALEKRGVTVVDLTPVFAQLKAAGIAPYCRQDSHYSPAGQQAAAAAVAAVITAKPWCGELPKEKVETRAETVEVNGDLALLAGEPLPPREKLTVRQVLVAGAFADDATLAERRRASPLVLIGDSHCLVYGDRTDLLADHANFANQLTAETGLLVDTAANRGSGINAPRLELLRRKDRMAGKKCVVWLFTGRLFTQATETWKVLNIIR